MQLVLTVNGMQYEVEARPTARLLDVLRDQLGLTGTKEGCAEGECGACTVIVDGRAVNSCVMLAVQARGKDVLTVEGLAEGGELDLLQQKFVEYGAVQCGYCTPGMLMSAKALLMANPVPSEQDIRIALAGNLCRCTGYSAIVAAVKAAGGQDATPAMVLPGEAEELTVEVSTDPETLAIVQEVVEAAAAELTEAAAPAPEAFPSPDAPAGPPAAPGPSSETPAGSSDTEEGE
jgi:aerobic carbon-monoxide dehydrogenase small subunit